VLDLGGYRHATSGAITFAGGVLQNGTLASSGTAFLAESGTINAVLSGIPGLVKSGTGMLTLSGANIYQSGTTVRAGTLLLAGGDNRLFSGGAITTAGGLLDLGGNTQSTAGTVTFAGGMVQNGTLLSVGAAFLAQSGTVNAVLGGSQGLLKSGPGILTFGGSGFYLGETRVEAGTLVLVGGDNLLPTSGDLIISGGALDLGGNRQTTSGTITFLGGSLQNGTLIAAGSPFDGRAGSVSGVLSGAQGLRKSGTGVLILSGSNT
jgi:autotransporter-associated beta strand protein